MEEKRCCLCGRIFTGFGNNAEPIKVGECCDVCNMSMVVPVRLQQLLEQRNSFTE